MPSVLWRCGLGGRKGIRPVKNWVVGCWRGYLSGARLQTCIWPSWCHCHSLSLASVKSRLVLPFWYRFTRVVPEKGPLNGCVCVKCYTFPGLCVAYIRRPKSCKYGWTDRVGDAVEERQTSWPRNQVGAHWRQLANTIKTSVCDDDGVLCQMTMTTCSGPYWHFSSMFIPSVLWRCWLGGRKGIRPAKNWVVDCWHGYLSGARCRLAYGPADATATHCLLL